jgi:hypothetical protein
MLAFLEQILLPKASINCTLHTVTIFLLDLHTLGCEFLLELTSPSSVPMAKHRD